jgi:hypothetical protein
MLSALPEQSVQADRPCRGLSTPGEREGELRAMRRMLVCRPAMGQVLMALATLGFSSQAVAQELPSLAGALDSPSANVWPGAAPPPAVGPTLADEYLEPVPAAEHGMFAPLPGAECSSCNGGGQGVGGIRSFYNRCGCDTPQFPWFAGPGTCDNWCVGPHWNVEVDGMFIHREDAAWGDVTGSEVVEQFEYGPGVRIFATGYNYSNYGLQIGYEGVNDFHSTGFLEEDVDVGDLTNPLEVTDYTYESTLNSLEINILRRTEIPLKVFVGFRYIEIDEEFLATTAISGGAAGADVDDVDGTLVENRLVGVQAGAFRDAWQLNRWITIEPYGNAGAYFNDFKREDLTLDGPTGALLIEKNEFDDIAFLGEAGVTGILRINACLALRGGYQVMAFQNVGTALETSTLARGFDPDDLIYHGARFGVEYQR